MDNPQIDLARRIVESTNTNIFLTGRAGTGKTTFLRRLRTELPKRMVVLAPTGIAAINAGGVTIHSFFQLPFAPYVPGTNFASQQRSFAMHKQKIKLIQSLDLLVIDEISMVRADLLDAVDNELKRIRRSSLPFGGVQLLMIGDLQQLAPVAKEEEWNMLSQYYDTPYFFSSLALKKSLYVTVELEKVYRQSDERFLAMLNEVREGNVSEQTLDALNKRYIPNFTPAKEDGYIQLVTHNRQAHEINNHEMEKLTGRAYNYNAVTKGKFPEMSYPTDAQLTLKEGAQVMFVKNDANKNYYNGMIGEVVSLMDDYFVVSPKEEPEKLIEVHPEVWENTRYALDEKSKEIKEVVEGTFIQFPIKLAWAITIHKSQGLTFDHVMIDAHASFAHGQTYVALSRCKTLEGIVLTSKISPSAIIADKSVEQFNEEMKQREVNEDKLQLLQHSYAVSLLSGLFDFEKENFLLSQLTRIFQEYLYKTFADTAQLVEERQGGFEAEVVSVAKTFYSQYQSLLTQSHGCLEDAALQDRVRKGANYFAEKLYSLRDFVASLALDIDRAEVKKRFDSVSEDLIKQLRIHYKLLEMVAEEGFVAKSYLQSRAKLMLQMDNKENNKKGSSKSQREVAPSKLTVPTEVKNALLYYRLKDWRRATAHEAGLPAYTVLSTKALMGIANYAPSTMNDLKRIPHFGVKSVEKYGNDILAIVVQYLQDKAEGKIDETKADEALPKQGESTFETSLRLYKAGHSAYEISQMRDLSLNTILGHLMRYIESGEVNFDDIVAPAQFAKLKDYFAKHPYSAEQKLADIRVALGEDFTYNDIRCSLMRLGLLNN